MKTEVSHLSLIKLEKLAQKLSKKRDEEEKNQNIKKNMFFVFIAVFNI